MCNLRKRSTNDKIILILDFTYKVIYRGLNKEVDGKDVTGKHAHTMFVDEF